MLPTMILLGKLHAFNHSAVRPITWVASAPSSETRPAKILMYAAPAFAASMAWLKERHAVALIVSPCFVSAEMTPKQGSPCVVMMGIFTTIFGAQEAISTACA